MTLKPQKSLVILSNAYPTEASLEGNFILPELTELRRQFNSIEILPTHAIGKPEPTPRGVKATLDLANAIGPVQFASKPSFAMKGLIALKKFSPNPKDTPPPLSRPKAVLAHLSNLGLANQIRSFLQHEIDRARWDTENTVFYSYWCKYSALALAWLKRKHPRAVAIARAHRNDLYQDEAPNRHISRQATIVSGLDAIYCISQHGKNYLDTLYPDFRETFHVARLGIARPPFRTRPSSDGKIRVVSCSLVTSVKRVPLILNALQELSSRSPQPIEWTHIGDGPKYQEIRKAAATSEHPRFSTHFPGRLSNREILNYYRSRSVDVFVNASSSEGIPVSIMEAMACGIPVVAPSVGGIPEIVTRHSGGILFSPDSSAQTIAKAIDEIVSDTTNWSKRSDAVFNAWSKDFLASRNHSSFAESVTNVAERIGDNKQSLHTRLAT